MIQVFVLYPAGEGKTFDHEYYATKHFALAGGLLGEKLKGGTMHKVLPSPDGPAPYVGGAVLLFDSVEDFQAGMAEHGAAIMGDIPNYTNIEPVIFVAEVTVGA